MHNRFSSKKRSFKISKKILIIFSVVLLLVGLVFFVKTGFFNVSAQEVNLNNVDCANKGEVEKSLKLSGFLFSVNTQELEKRLQNKYFCIGSVQITKNFPNKLKVEVKGREAVFQINLINAKPVFNAKILNLTEAEATESSRTAQISTEELVKNVSQYTQASGSGKFLVDKNGVIFKMEEKEGLQKVNYFGGEMRVGDKMGAELISNLQQIFGKLQMLEIARDNVTVLADRVIVDSTPTVLFSLNKRLDYQLASLQLILQKAKINSNPSESDKKTVQSVDLRFDKPIVVYGKKN